MGIGNIIKILLCVVVILASVFMNTILGVVMPEYMAGLICSVFIVGAVIVLVK